MTVTAAIKTGGSGTLQNLRDGTTLTVEQVAVKMISVSDNTGADLLLKLVGRAAVEAQVRAWAANPSLDMPFLTASEMFALKYADYPARANHYLSLNASQRAAYLATTADWVPSSAERAATAPRDINSIEWFASADDLCRAFSGLARLNAEPGLSPLNTILSTNNLGNTRSQQGRLADRLVQGRLRTRRADDGVPGRDSRGPSFVVIALTENPRSGVHQESVAVEFQSPRCDLGRVRTTALSRGSPKRDPTTH